MHALPPGRSEGRDCASPALCPHRHLQRCTRLRRLQAAQDSAVALQKQPGREREVNMRERETSFTRKSEVTAKEVGPGGGEGGGGQRPPEGGAT